MADYDRNNALIEFLFVRVPKPSGNDEYLPLQYNFVTYDDGVTYVEPENLAGIGPYTNTDVNPLATSGKVTILDGDPFDVTGFR